MERTNMLLKSFHVSVVVINSFTIWYDQMYVDLPFPTEEIAALPLKARYLFLTVWCLSFHVSVVAINSFTIWYDQMYVDLPFPSEELAALPLKARYLFLTMWCLSFHVSVVAINSFAIWYDQMYVDLPFPSEKLAAMPLKARYIFLTVWCLVLQTLYFGVSFLNDVYGTDSPAPKNPPVIRRIKDGMFSLSFTVALYVSMTFWGIYSINKDLIFPIEIESRFPKWSNHVMHTFIVPFILIEMFATKRNYPSRRFGINTLITFISTYTLWVLVIYIKTGVWVYPFLDLLNWTMKAIFAVTSTCIGLGIYVLGEQLNSFLSRSAKGYVSGVNGHMKRH